jgi:FkbM family methyltransferase
MFLTPVFKFFLKRPFFRGQDRIFNFLFKKSWTDIGTVTTKTSMGNFFINVDTSTWIGAKVAFLGDYEPEIKKIFKSYINNKDTVLDIGANIGLHTLYFSELVGTEGKVISFEPVPYNFRRLQENVKLNNAANIETENIALSDKNEIININIDEKSSNPGSFNLFELNGSVKIDCRIGDEIVGDEKVDFIKIDVEGYEGYVIAGLLKTIEKNKPFIIFEYDLNYQEKTGLPKDYIFNLLRPLGYSFYLIKRSGIVLFDEQKDKSANIIAKPINKL